MPRERQPILPEPTPQERHNMIDDRLQMQIVNPVGPRIADFFINLRTELNTGGNDSIPAKAIDTIWEMTPDRGMEPERKADYIIEWLPRAASAILMADNPDFIQSIRWPGFWKRLEDPLVLQDLVFHTMLPILTNKYERGKVLDILMKIYGFWEDNILLEMGGGGGYIGKNLVLRDGYPPTKVMERVRKGAANTIQENPSLSSDFDTALSLPLHFKRVVNVDLLNPDDPFYKLTRLACTLTLDERADQEKVDEVNRLELAQPENVGWKWGDITDYTPGEHRTEFPDEPLPNVIAAFYVLYLMKKEQQQLGLRNMADFAIQSGGIGVVLDDIRYIDQNHQPQIVRRRRDFSTTGAWVFNGKRPEQGWLKFLSIRTGRIDAVIPEPAFANVQLQELQKATKRRRRV